MSQVVDQSFQPGGAEPSDNKYMVPVNGIQSTPQKGKVTDYNAGGITFFNFQDYGLKKESGTFDTEKIYYLHARVKRMNTPQIYNVKLMSSNSSVKMTQQIKNFEISSAIPPTGSQVITEYVDVEFLFTPLSDFDIIAFELERRPEYDIINQQGDIIGGRDPAIAFIEFSTVENKKPGTKPLKKIGLQSHPDLLFCINGEEFHLPRSGIFELRDGIVDITFFSIVTAAKLQNETSELAPQMENNETINLIDRPKEPRIIDGYMLDYMYSNSGED